MTTPIVDFVRQYAQSETLRLHMPGHKGRSILGPETWDLTEIAGADELYAPEGIIAESEANATRLFGCRTVYSAEGSSLAIRAMLYLAIAGRQGRPCILAGRNAHKVFVYTAALLDFDIAWLCYHGDYHSCAVTAADAEREILRCHPCAVYLTSPDYLGNMVDIAAISRVCRRYGVLLLVDNAHGAYLRFLQPSQHPMDLGADLCCDSAHKTLPVLTGGAYLHSREERDLKGAMALFGSTSPSYLILQSLDLCNIYLEGEQSRLAAYCPEAIRFRQALAAMGIPVVGAEPLKVTIHASAYGYTGAELADILRENRVEPEFADPDYLVLMLTPEIDSKMLSFLERVFAEIPPKEPLKRQAPVPSKPDPVLTPRQAMFAPRERISAEQAQGRIFADAALSCPPAIPVVICGERLDENAVKSLEYYGIDTVQVAKE